MARHYFQPDAETEAALAGLVAQWGASSTNAVLVTLVRERVGLPPFEKRGRTPGTGVVPLPVPQPPPWLEENARQQRADDARLVGSGPPVTLRDPFGPEAPAWVREKAHDIGKLDPHDRDLLKRWMQGEDAAQDSGVFSLSVWPKPPEEYAAGPPEPSGNDADPLHPAPLTPRDLDDPDAPEWVRQGVQRVNAGDDDEELYDRLRRWRRGEDVEPPAPTP